MEIINPDDSQLGGIRKEKKTPYTGDLDDEEINNNNEKYKGF